VHAAQVELGEPAEREVGVEGEAHEGLGAGEEPAGGEAGAVEGAGSALGRGGGLGAWLGWGVVGVGKCGTGWMGTHL
jgi:hypothetical protein